MINENRHVVVSLLWRSYMSKKNRYEAKGKVIINEIQSEIELNF